MAKQYGTYGKPFSSTGGMSGGMMKPKSAPGGKSRMGSPGMGGGQSSIWLPGVEHRPKQGQSDIVGPITALPSPPQQNVRQAMRHDVAGNLRKMAFTGSPEFAAAAQKAGLLNQERGNPAAGLVGFDSNSPGGLLFTKLNEMSGEYGGAESFFRAFGVNPNSPKEIENFLGQRLGAVVSEYGGDWLAAVRRVVADMNYEASGLLAGSPEESVFGGGELQGLIDALNQLGGMTGATPAEETPEEQMFGPIVNPQLLSTPFGF